MKVLLSSHPDIDPPGPVPAEGAGGEAAHEEDHHGLPEGCRRASLSTLHLGPVHLRAAADAKAEVSPAQAALPDLLARPESS